MLVVDGLRDDAVVAVTDELFVGGGGDADLQAFFDHAGLEAAAGGGGQAEEELEWLSNKDAFPTVETIAPAPAPTVVAPRTKGLRRRPRTVAWSPSQALQPRPRAAAAARRCRHCGTKRTPEWRDDPEDRRTLCNACGVRYRSGRLLPEYRPVNSPTFSPELHSNKHRRVVEMHRLQNKDAFPTVETISPASAPAPAAVAPRTKGVRPTFSSDLHSNKHRRVVELHRRPNKDASTTVETIAPAPVPEPAVVAPRTKGVRPTFYPELHYNKHRRVIEIHRRPNKDASAMVETIAPAPAPAVVAPRTKGVRRRRRTVAWSPPQALLPRLPAGRRCRHCGTERTPQWREGPEGRGTLCNACGVQYRKGRLLPEYRPVDSPTFSPELHSNKHRCVVKMRLRRELPAASASDK